VPVVVRTYSSSTLVLLAYDWPAADQHPDFRGYGIERTPGFAGEPRSWLPRQQGYWWDASIDASDRGARFQYRVVPVIGPEASPRLLDDEAGEVEVLVP
jgi:hypothetical protein